MDPCSLVSVQHLSSNALAKGTADLEFVAKFGELWGNPRKYKSHTSPGRKFALLEGLSHDLKSVGRIDLSCPFCVAGVALAP